MSDKEFIIFLGDADILEALDYLGRERYQESNETTYKLSCSKSSWILKAAGMI